MILTAYFIRCETENVTSDDGAMKEKTDIEVKRYEALCCGRSSPESLAF